MAIIPHGLRAAGEGFVDRIVSDIMPKGRQQRINRFELRAHGPCAKAEGRHSNELRTAIQPAVLGHRSVDRRFRGAHWSSHRGTSPVMPTITSHGPEFGESGGPTRIRFPSALFVRKIARGQLLADQRDGQGRLPGRRRSVRGLPRIGMCNNGKNSGDTLCRMPLGECCSSARRGRSENRTTSAIIAQRRTKMPRPTARPVPS